MKLINSITLLLCLFPGLLSAQPKPLPDSIRLEFPDLHSLITFELHQYAGDKSVIRNFPNQLQGIVRHIKSSLTASDESRPQQVEVVYSENERDAEKYTIRIEAIATPETKVTVGQDAVLELLPPGWKVIIKMKNAEVHIYAPDVDQLEELAHVNLEPVVVQLDNDPEIQRQKRFGLISRIIIKDGKAQTAQTTHRLPNDMLGLEAGAGVGLLQDKFYPEFNFTTSFYLANRYKQYHQRISAHYELKLFSGRSPEGAYRSWPASFVSVSYALNFAKDHPNWTGIGAGFLVHNRSDLFTGKTMKLFLETNIGSPKLNIIPELYLTDDYKRALYGIKLNYKF